MKALILSCGGSPEPLIFCIENFKPDFTYFLCSDGSVDIAMDIAKLCNLNDDQFNLKVVKNYDSLEDSFAKSREIIKELQGQYDDIHVDFTGGTKPMVSGLVLAAIGEECTYSYVGTDDLEGRDKNGLGVVQDGFESIIDQKDPYDVYAVLEFERGMDLFNQYQFKAAKINFDNASEKLESKNLKEIAEIFSYIVDVYDSWDKFNNEYSSKPIKSAFYNIFTVIENSENLKHYFEVEHPDFFIQMKNNWDFLELKISRKGIMKKENAIYYLPDLLNNAYRRIDEGKYDDAVARLYRTAELIAQLGLTNEGLIKESVLKENKEFKIDLNVIDELDNEDAKLFVYNLYEYENALRYNKNHIGIGSDKSFRLLSKLGVDYADEFLNDKKIKSNIGSRNGSILAHGLKPIDSKKAMILYSQVLEYAERVFPDIEKYMSMSKFPKFE